MYGNRKSLFHTRNKQRIEFLNLFLARNRHGSEAIHYSTFYYAETNTCILFLTFFLCKTANNTLAVLAIHELNRIFPGHNRDSAIW